MFCILYGCNDTQSTMHLLMRTSSRVFFQNLLSELLFEDNSKKYYLKSYLGKKSYSIYLSSPTTFLYLMRSLESHPCSLSLTSKKFGIEDIYNWISN
jgi:hypothetical protein